MFSWKKAWAFRPGIVYSFRGKIEVRVISEAILGVYHLFDFVVVLSIEALFQQESFDDFDERNGARGGICHLGWMHANIGN